MQSKPLTPPTVSQERATHQQCCQQCEYTTTALHSTAVHCSGSNCGKATLCTKFWCKSVSLTVTRTLHHPTSWKKKNTIFQTIAFVGVTTVHQTCMRCSNTSGEKWKLKTHLEPNKPWTCFTASTKINMFSFTCFCREAHLNEGNVTGIRFLSLSFWNEDLDKKLFRDSHKLLVRSPAQKRSLSLDAKGGSNCMYQCWLHMYKMHYENVSLRSKFDEGPAFFISLYSSEIQYSSDTALNNYPPPWGGNPLIRALKVIKSKRKAITLWWPYTSQHLRLTKALFTWD